MAKEIARIQPAKAPVPSADTTSRMLLEFQSPTMALIARPVPPMSGRLTWVLASMMAVLLTLGGTVPIDRVVSGSGKIVTESETILVQPLENSIVRSIDVKIGQHVRKGDSLAHLDPTFAGADLAALETQSKSLTAETARLRAELNGTVYRSDGTRDGDIQAEFFAVREAAQRFKVESYRQKISSLETALHKAQDELKVNTQRFGLASSLLQSREEAQRLGVGSKLNTLSAQDSKAQAQNAMEDSRSAVVSTRKDLDALIAERDGMIKQYQSETSQLLSDEQRKLDDVLQQLSKARRMRDLVDLRADQDSVVLAIANVSVGSVLQAAQPFMTLVPEDAKMEIDAAIPAADIGFIRVGDEANIKFDAYNEREHGYAEGRVRVIAPDSQNNTSSASGGGPAPSPGQSQFTPSGPSISSLGVPLGSEVFRVKVSIESLKMHDLPSDFRLQPGLTATVDLLVGRRTVLSYLLTRFIPAFKEGMREP